MIAAAYADLLSTVIEEKNFRKIDDRPLRSDLGAACRAAS
jgi:hypothetical protein